MQQSTILLADSGSTKTDWILTCDDNKLYQRFHTTGLNPCILDNNDISNILRTELIPRIVSNTISEVRFYGAGCRGEAAQRMSECLRDVIGAERVIVESDLLGAARILCHDAAGIVCILGTGSASCHYDGQFIVQQVPSLGFILGDEGSGAVLGRKLIGYIYKNGADDALVAAFQQKYNLTVDRVIESVYRQPAPNRFLANFTHFISEHIEHPDLQRLVHNEFDCFFKKNIHAYAVSQMGNRIPLYFVGSIADVFRKQLHEVASQNGYQIDCIVRHPLDAILQPRPLAL